MVRRPPDSRLLTNLLSHEKDYHKQLLTLLDISHASLSSFAAYAAASSYQTSQVILAVTNSLAGVDEALLRYTSSVDDWREHLKRLKDLEDEVGNVMRDREILVTRVLKASKSQKPNRDSHALTQPYPSTSSVSLKSEYSGALTTSSKLAMAQTELQACEAHLAEKERELETLRIATIQEGLRLRCKALVECAYVWGEKGREAIGVIDGLGAGGEPHDAIPQVEEGTSQKPLPEMARRSSDISSISPSQSASQVHAAAPIAPAADSTHIYSDANYVDFGASSVNSHSHSHQHLDVPPAHAISDIAVPTSHPVPELLQPPVTSNNTTKSKKSTQQHLGNGHANRRHILSHRITEEDLHADDSSDDDDDEPRQVTVVENPRFAASAPPPTPPSATVNRRFSLRPHLHSTPPSAPPSTSSNEFGFSSKRDRRISSTGSGFFGSLKGLFRNRDIHATDSDTPRSPRSPSRGFFGVGRKGGEPKTSGWTTRTDQNLRSIGDRDSDEEKRFSRGGIRATSMDGSPNIRPVSTLAPPLSFRRERTISEVGAAAVPSAIGPSSITGRRLKKAKTTSGKERSSSVPPAHATELDSSTRRAEKWVDGQGEHERAALAESQRDKQALANLPPRSLVPNGDASAGRAWESDVGPTIAAAPRRKKSKGKVKASATTTPAAQPTVISPTHPATVPTVTVSRTSSSQSTGSARGAAPKRKKTVRRATAETGQIQSPPPAQKTRARPVSPGTATGGAVGPQTSLMSIVQDVARGNREGWAHADRIKSAGGSVVPASSVVLHMPKAPLSLGRDQLALAVMSESLGGGAGGGAVGGFRGSGGSGVVKLAVPKAPGSVFDAIHAAASSQGEAGVGSPKTSAAAGVVRATAISSPRPTKAPLRSALRQPSRTPSPGSSAALGTAEPTMPPVPQAPPRIVIVDGDVKGKGKARVHPSDSEERDGNVSTSSYETGHEVLTGEDTDFEREERTGAGQYAPPLASHPTSAVAQPTTTAQPAQVQEGGQQPQPQRRKSVRVSLKPTFSPTPPAFDQTDEEDEEREEESFYASYKPLPPAPISTAAEAGDPPPRKRVVLEEGSVPDLWEDSGDEEEEYAMAKKWLNKSAAAAKKISPNGW